MSWILIPTVVVVYLSVLLVQLRMGWLGIGPMFINFVGITILVMFVSSKLVARKVTPHPRFSFRVFVITASLLFCTISSNVLLQLGQKQLFGRVWVSDTSRETYEEQHGKTEEILGMEMTEVQAENFMFVQRLAHEAIKVISEEVVFRWFVLGALLLLMTPSRAIIISAFIFAGAHIVFPIAVSDAQFGLTRLLPMFAIGIFCGVAYFWFGLPASIFVHFFTNLIRVFAHDKYDFLVDWIIWGSAFCAVVLLAPTLWFTRKLDFPA